MEPTDTKACKNCGSIKPLEQFYRQKLGRGGRTAKCKPCFKSIYKRPYDSEARKKSHATYYGRHRERVMKMARAEYRRNHGTHMKRAHSPRGRFLSYRNDAKRRGHEFALSFEQFSKFWQSPCHYCGREIAEVGLDRVNNLQGYLITNVVSCCRPCNMAKRDLTKSEFVALCYSVIRKHEERENKKNLATVS